MSEKSTTAGQEWRKNWPLVAAATAGMSLASVSPASIGVMMAPMEQDLGWTRAEISSGPMLISLTVVGVGTLLGAAIDRFGVRQIAIVAVTMLCGAIALLSQVGHELWQWWTIWALVGLSSATMPAVWLKAITGSFDAGRGLALAIVLCGSGITSAIVPTLANNLVDSHGWRLAYLYLGGIWCVVALPLVVLFFRPRYAARTSDAAATAPSAGLSGLTLREGFTSPVFYKLAFGALASTFAGTALVLNLVPVLRSTGLTAMNAAAIVGFIGLATIAGRIAGGWFMDRVGPSAIAATSCGVMIALPLTLLVLPGSIPASIFAVTIFGLMGGAMTPAIADLAGKHLGSRSFGAFYSTINAVISISVGTGPLVASIVYDNFKSYIPVLWGAIPLFALASLLYASLGSYRNFETTQSRTST